MNKIIKLLTCLLLINQFNGSFLSKLKRNVIRHGILDKPTTDDIIHDINNVFVCEKMHAYQLTSLKVAKTNEFKCTEKTILVEYEIKRIEGFSKGSGYLLPYSGCLASKPINFSKDHCKTIKRYFFTGLLSCLN